MADFSKAVFLQPRWFSLRACVQNLSLDKRVLFEACIYIGQDKKGLKKILLKAGNLRVSTDECELILGEYCCDLTVSIEGKGEESRTISALSKFHCITNALSHCREWVRGVIEECGQDNLYLDVDGEFRELSLDLIFATNDCVTWEMQDKIEFAEASGYKEDWQSMEDIEPSVASECSLKLMSDFGQIQIFDKFFDGQETPDWNENAHRNFACYVKGALFLRVMENDDHIVGFELCENEPNKDVGQFVHVVDAPFVTTGLFEIAGQPVKVAAGRYVIRWYVRRSKDNQWDYQIKMWPKNTRKVSVLKMYQGEN